MKKTSTKIIRIDMNSHVDLDDITKWSQETVDFVANSIVNKFQKHNPIELVEMAENSYSYSLNFKVHYTAKDSSATRFANIERVKEQLIMECF